MGFIVQIFGLVFKLILRVLWFIGVYWIVICMSPVWLYEWIGSSVAKKQGSFLGMTPNALGNILAPEWLYTITFYIALFFMALTIIQNILRLIKEDPKYNIFGTIFGKIGGNKAMGFVAALNLDSLKDLSGFVFGKLGDKYVTKKESEDGHMLVIGGAGSGKTSCVAIPTLMSWQGRVFAIDIKGELYQKTSRARDKNYIKVFNPSDRSANGYDPLYILRNCDDETEAVKEIAQAIIPLPIDDKNPYWITSSQNILAGGILYYSSMGMSFTQIMEAIKMQPVKVMLSEIMESDHKKAKMYISDYFNLKDELLGTIASELSNHILPFAVNESLRQALDGHGDCITPDDLEKGYDIYICIEESKIEQWRGLLTMMCNQFLKAFERRPEGSSKPILFLLDEFPRLGKIEAITNGLATLRSKKVQIALFLQSKSQLNAIYGKDMSEVIADNCNYKAILKATEPATQSWCSKLVGTYDKEKLSSNVNADMIGIGKGTGTSKTTEEKAIIKPEEFGFMQDIVVVFPTGYSRIEKAPYYKDNAFKNK